ncbi:MAG: NUDIX domain-containing protein [Armatimonadetes bacterium]|nr:NUDIX domain-containing protein [Armatimonadota bacterium]
MHRASLLRRLAAYRTIWAEGAIHYPGYHREREHGVLERFERFVRETPTCFERSHSQGHVTGSALVVSENGRVLLTLHRKLGAWLQLGGHADGDPEVQRVALKEAEEESGLPDLRFLSYEGRVGAEPHLPFDLDIHAIPARPGEPEHYHYDVRFLLVTSEPVLARATSESRALRWFELPKAREITREESMLRQFDKLEALYL